MPIHFSWYLTSPESPCENVEAPKFHLKGSDTTGAAWMLWDLIGISWAYHGHIPGNQTWMAVKFPMAMEVYSWGNQRTKWWICPWPRLIFKGYAMRYSNSPAKTFPNVRFYMWDGLAQIKLCGFGDQSFDASQYGMAE